MNVIKTSNDGVIIIEPEIIMDDNGNYIYESFSQKEFDEKVTPI